MTKFNKFEHYDDCPALDSRRMQDCTCDERAQEEWEDTVDDWIKGYYFGEQCDADETKK